MRLLVLLVLLLQVLPWSRGLDPDGPWSPSPTVVTAQDSEYETATLDEQEATEHDARRLYDGEALDPLALAEPAPPPPPAPTPEPTPDPNIPPGFEEMELIAFRLEYAEDFALIALMEWAYDWVAKDRRHDDGLLRARDLPDFLRRTLNPAEEDIADDEHTLLQTASDLLREEQGLSDDDMRVYIGFLSRGSPARFVRQLAHDMHHQNRARRLQAAMDESGRDL